MNYAQSEGSDTSGLGSSSTFFQKRWWRVSLFISTLLFVIGGHLGFFYLPAKAAPNPDIAILNAFVPNNADPGFPTTYRLTFRNIGDSPANIISLSHTLPSSPGSLVFDAIAPTTNTCGSNFTIDNSGSNPGSPAAFTITGGDNSKLQALQVSA